MLMVQKSDGRKKNKTVGLANLPHVYTLPETNSKFAPESGLVGRRSFPIWHGFLVGAFAVSFIGGKKTSPGGLAIVLLPWFASQPFFCFQHKKTYEQKAFFKKTSQRFQRIKGLFSEDISR